MFAFAITAGPMVIGDELEPPGGRCAGVGVSAFSGGYIPVTSYQAQVYEVLGRRAGGGPGPQRPRPQSPPTTTETQPPTPHMPR